MCSADAARRARDVCRRRRHRETLLFGARSLEMRLLRRGDTLRDPGTPLGRIRVSIFIHQPVSRPRRPRNPARVAIPDSFFIVLRFTVNELRDLRACERSPYNENPRANVGGKTASITRREAMKRARVYAGYRTLWRANVNIRDTQREI